jgi:hypothetical protein
MEKNKPNNDNKSKGEKRNFSSDKPKPNTPKSATPPPPPKKK